MSKRTVVGALLLGLTVGILIGSVVGNPLTTGVQPPTSNSAPPTTYSSSGPSCYDGPEENTGWLHVVANGETWATTLDATIVHPRGTEVDLNVSQRPAGTYEIAFTTGEATSASKAVGSPENCRLATTLNVGTALPRPDFVITVNGRTIRSVTQEETVANLYPLPNPINATA